MQDIPVKNPQAVFIPKHNLTVCAVTLWDISITNIFKNLCCLLPILCGQRHMVLSCLSVWASMRARVKKGCHYTTEPPSCSFAYQILVAFFYCNRLYQVLFSNWVNNYAFSFVPGLTRTSPISNRSKTVEGW